ncbi:ISMha3, family IS1595 [Glaesserella parasuis ZJ0906]|uniref:ISMha3, family IS1595 n=1 Tax=Glaesserella parasuis ZJ0906 TaxID=1322346 RepID=A0A806J4R3_GLAPU|nr:ISMha3, family IS1595 [Glaesserella parasuis ZJ0906]
MKAILAATRKGKRGRGAVGKTAVFGLLKRDGKVYTVVVPNTQSAILLPIVSEFNHFRINHSNLKS